jgi:ABC-type glycerol-3-phosphate transport system permease component
MNYLIALTVNLAGMLLIYSLMAFGLVRLSWKQRGITPVLITIIISGFFWSVPTILVFFQDAKSADAVSYSLWLGNWLVSGFSVIILCQTLKGIPRQLEDSARLDGCGRFAIYWHVLLPLIKRELGLIAFLTLMGTSGLCWAALTMPGGGHGFFPPWMRWLSVPPLAGEPNPSLGILVIGEMIAGCIVVNLPVMLILLFSKRYLLRPAQFEDK